jgi:hypothetical protein
MGILESRNVTYDRSMRKLAKALPLDTPTTIELAPGNSIRVTLVDANHCVGAVMFLIEGDSKAVLYTGDIRAETWWVNSIVQNPVLLPYTLGDRRLDCMYLDTTFATKREPYKTFPSKAEGIRELIQKVSQYPDDTVFYFHSWTFGYENVWIALSSFLETRIHLDDYRARIYGSLSTLDKKQLRESGLNVQSDNKSLRESGLEVREATALCGFRNGNHIQPGCLTSRESVRIHSCEQGMGCRVLDRDEQAKIVHIIPIVTRANGTEIAELGAGGGKGDLDQKEELEPFGAPELAKLMELCAETIQDEQVLSKVLELLKQTFAQSNGNLDLNMQQQKASIDSQDGLSLRALISVLSSSASKPVTTEGPRNRTIRFPYSRHSSYSELCELVAAFKPQDVFPCTVDEGHWTPDLSIQSLFGEYCSASTFRHNAEMVGLYEARMRQQNDKRNQESQETQSTDDDLPKSADTVKRSRESFGTSLDQEFATADEVPDCKISTARGPQVPRTSIENVRSPWHSSNNATTGDAGGSSSPAPQPVCPPSTLASVTLPALAAPTSSLAAAFALSSSSGRKRKKKVTNKQLAYEAAIGTHLTWADFGGLTSTRAPEEYDEMEL